MKKSKSVKTASKRTVKNVSAKRGGGPPTVSHVELAATEITVETKNMIQNGLAEAIGYPGDQGTGWGQMISQVNTLFQNNRWYLVSNMRQLLSEIFVEIGLVQTVVEVPVDDGLRGGITIKSKELDEDEIEELTSSLDRDDDLTVVGQALKWNRLFGGAGIVIITDQDPSTPLDLESIDKETPVEFRAVDMWELFYSKQNVEDYSLLIDGDGEDTVETYDYYGVQLHKSRVLIMRGLTAPSFVRPRLRGWGFSVVEALVRSINQYLKATDLGFEVLDEFKVDVYKIKNLTNSLLSGDGEAAIKRRVGMANWQKNYQHALVMDSEDDFDHKQLSFAGLADTMAGIRMQVASDMRMPITKLFGISAAGFNSGEDDIEVYNAMVESTVRNKCKYEILRILEIKCQKLFGFVPEDLKIEFQSLRILGAEAEETVKTQKFTRLMTAKEKGEITRFEFREGCNKDNLLSITLDTTSDQLNPDDPDVADLVAGEPSEDELSRDTEDVDADSETPAPAATAGGSVTKPKEAKVAKEAAISNSLMFDVQAYLADGGDSQFADRRQILFEDPMKYLDSSLYQRAKERAMKALGKPSWKFTLWWYKNNGGRLK